MERERSGGAVVRSMSMDLLEFLEEGVGQTMRRRKGNQKKRRKKLAGIEIRTWV